MAVKLRLVRMGKTKQPTYRVVASDARSPRNGRFIELLGTYEPRLEPSGIKINAEKATKWLSEGAQPTERVQKLLLATGILSAEAGGKTAAGQKASRRPVRPPKPTQSKISKHAPKAPAEPPAAVADKPEPVAESAPPEAPSEEAVTEDVSKPPDASAAAPENSGSSPDASADAPDNSGSSPDASAAVPENSADASADAPEAAKDAES